jgi:mono/diheme cytochrome c family protein
MVATFDEAYTEPTGIYEEGGMLLRSMLVLLFILFGSSAYADVQPMFNPNRGELLYSMHCIACHTEQVHWRDKKLAKDFQSLRAEVHRWQKLSALGWSDEDIAGVARYLNTLYYHYPAPY